MKTFVHVLLAIVILPQAARAADRRVTIVNETTNTMVRFYASNANKKGWDQDILGQQVLKPRQSVRINVDDGTDACIYDFRADFDDGAKLTRNAINVCEIATYRYTTN